MSASKTKKKPLLDERGRPRRVSMEARSTFAVVDAVQFYTGFIRNISNGGVFVATFDAPEIGTRVSVSFTVPGSQKVVDLTAEVRWTRHEAASTEAEPGFGAAFLDLPPELEGLIDEFLYQHESLFHESG
jgi:uncharacterized protein (TIGR02266 family)